MVARALFSSAKEDWATPQDLFDRLHAEFQFALDAAATPENAKCAAYLTDALNEPWSLWQSVFCNPPYSRRLIQWVDKAASSGATVVMLVPARPDTKWFARAFETATELRFIKGRLKFGGAKTSAPFPSCLFIFRPGYEGVKTVRYMESK